MFLLQIAILGRGLREFTVEGELAGGGEGVARPEIVDNCFARLHHHTRMRQHLVEQTLHHQQHLRAAGYIGMGTNREYRVLVLPIDPVELVNAICARHYADGVERMRTWRKGNSIR